MEAARIIVRDLASRLANRVQLSTDGYRAYITAIKGTFGDDVDYGRLIKIYGQDDQGREIVTKIVKETIIGTVEDDSICTSHVERQNLTMRMNMRRFTRLTNGFSKKVENHAAMVSIHFLNYNLIRKHQTIKTAPAVAAGVLDKPMKMEEACEIFQEYREANYPVDRPQRYRKTPPKQEIYATQTPLTPWYLDPESGGPNPPHDQRKAGIEYRDQ